MVGTHMCTNHINTKRKELETLFYSKREMGVLLITKQINEGNKEMKAPKTKPNLNLHLHLLGIRGSIEILIPGRLRKALDLGIDRLAKGVYPIPQLHSIYLRFGYAHVVEA